MLALLARTSPSYILLSSIDSDLEGKIKDKNKPWKSSLQLRSWYQTESHCEWGFYQSCEIKVNLSRFLLPSLSGKLCPHGMDLLRRRTESWKPRGAVQALTGIDQAELISKDLPQIPPPGQGFCSSLSHAVLSRGLGSGAKTLTLSTNRLCNILV